MEYQFDWRTPMNQKTREIVEAQIGNDLESHSLFKPCHTGAVLATLSSSDPFEESIVGNIKCKCGKPIGTLKGAMDVSKMTYAAIE